MPRFGLATLNHSPLHGLPVQWETHLEAAAGAGLEALAPDVFWLRALEAEGVPLERLAAGLEARGLGCMEIAGIALGEAEQTAAELAEVLRFVEILGAERVNARVLEPPGPALREQLRRCAEALARVGCGVALEFSRGTRVHGVADALALVEATGAPGVGLTLDTWHFFLAREGPDWGALEALAVEAIANVQLSDGVPFGDRPYGEATMHERRLPGDGDFDLGRFGAVLHEKGFDGAVVIEVLSAPLRERPLAEFAHRAARSARRWWAETGVSPSR